MRALLAEWVGEQICIAFLTATVVDGYSGFESITGRLVSVDTMGVVVVDDEVTWTDYRSADGPAKRCGCDTSCIPWSAIARIWQRVPGRAGGGG